MAVLPFTSLRVLWGSHAGRVIHWAKGGACGTGVFEVDQVRRDMCVLGRSFSHRAN